MTTANTFRKTTALTMVAALMVPEPSLGACKWFKICGFTPGLQVQAVDSTNPGCVYANSVLPVAGVDGCARVELCTANIDCFGCPEAVYVTVRLATCREKTVALGCAVCPGPFNLPLNSVPFSETCTPAICNSGGGGEPSSAHDVTACASLDDHFWNNAGVGHFADPSNWYELVPGSDDAAHISLSGVAPGVSFFGVSPVNERLIVGGEEVTFDLFANTYELTCPSSAGPSIVIDGGPHHVARLNVTSSLVPLDPGATLVSRHAVVGSQFSGEMTISSRVQWLNQDQLTVARSDSGSLIIEAGGQVVSDVGILGADPGSAGTLTVSGDGSAWEADELRVGGQGNGSVLVSEGGSLSGTCVVGDQPGASGTVSISGASSAASADEVTAGAGGQGAFTVSDGATMFSSVSVVGDQPEALGEVTVQDLGTSWNGSVTVGMAGSGTLRIENGGSLNGTVVVGAETGSSGSVTVSGAESILSGYRMTAGAGGVGSVIVENQGTMFHTSLSCLQLDQTNEVLIAEDSGSEANMTVTGTGSNWTTLCGITIAQAGNGALSIRDGGTCWNASGRTLVAELPGSAATVEVTGFGSEWEAAHIYLGGDELAGGGTATLTVADGGLVSTGELQVWPTAQIVLDGGTITSAAVALEGGAVSGNGVFEASAVDYGFINRGVLAPGLSPGTLVIDGDYYQDVSGTLEIEIAGTAAGEFDQLQVTGSASLAGTLTVSFIEGFVPSGSLSLPIVTAEFVEGFFDEVTVSGAEAQVAVGPDGIVLHVGGPADLNGDGTVDGFDLGVLLGSWGPYGSCPPHIPADLNHDCIVDAFDLSILLGSWES